MKPHIIKGHYSLWYVLDDRTKLTSNNVHFSFASACNEAERMHRVKTYKSPIYPKAKNV